MTSSSTATPDRRATWGATVRAWPAALGLVTGAAIGLADEAAVPAVILVSASIYALAAVAGRPQSAWIAFAASVPAIGVGRLLGAPWLALALIGAATVVVVMVGAVRGSWWAPARRRQLTALVVFGALALATLLVVSFPMASILAAAALLGHAGWDIAHHRRGEIVAPAYAAFCASLDVALAGVLLGLTVLRIGA